MVELIGHTKWKRAVLVLPLAAAEGDGFGANERPGHSSRDTENPLSLTAITLCGINP